MTQSYLYAMSGSYVLGRDSEMVLEATARQTLRLCEIIFGTSHRHHFIVTKLGIVDANKNGRPLVDIPDGAGFDVAEHPVIKLDPSVPWYAGMAVVMHVKYTGWVSKDECMGAEALFSTILRGMG
jgi:hypothetical protein